MTTPQDGDGIAATLSDPKKFLQILPGLISEPLGAVSVAQQLISLHRNSPDQLASLFHHGVPVLPPTDLVGALLPFLAPEPVESSARRAQRRQQMKILEGQVNWPDLGAAQGTAHIICSDSDSEIGLPKQLYFSGQDRELVSLSSFSQLISRLVSLTTGGVLADTSSRSSPTEAALSNVLYELFKNTEDHATHELSGADIRGSVRGIYAQFFGAPHQIPEKAKDIVHSSPSRAYWEHSLETKRRPARKSAAAGVLEISVFDSGPGMAARWSGREVSSESAADQIASVLACFKKGQTSTAAPSRGFGLWKVLRAVEEVRGLITVRTNGIRAYRRFDASIYRGANQITQFGERNIPEESLLDWRMGFARKFSLFPHVRGTVVSVLLPVDQ